MRMMPQLDVGLVRETGTILAIYLSTLLTGYSTGFSAVAVPDIKVDRRWWRWNDISNDKISKYFIGVILLTLISRLQDHRTRICLGLVILKL